MRLAIWFYAFVFWSIVYHAKCSLIESNYEPEEDIEKNRNISILIMLTTSEMNMIYSKLSVN